MRQRLAIRLLQLNLHVREYRHMVLRCESGQMINASVKNDTGKKKKTHLVLHAEFALALRRPAQLVRITKHIVQRYLRHGRELVLADLAINNCPPARIKPTDHRTWITALVSTTSEWGGGLRTLKFDGRDNFDRHDRLKYDRFGLEVRLTERAYSSEAKREL
jgi:hypothetical protein